MKAMMLNNYGDNASFEKKDIDKPAAGTGQVLVKIHASSVNPVDLKIKSNGKDMPIAPDLPALLGMDFAGIVEEVGPEVSDFKKGDEVYGCAGGLLDLSGTYTEYIAADARLMALKPKNLSMREAAALPLVSITAFEGVERAQIGNGQKVLVHGGSGGVGHITLQLAKIKGAEVSATSSSDEKLNLIKELGAHPINYEDQSVEDYVNDFTDGQGFDAIYDTVGGKNLLKSFEAAKINAQIATTVSMAEVDLSQMHHKGLSLHVVFMLIPMIHNTDRASHGKILKEITSLVESGKLKPVLDENRYRLEDVNEAHARVASGEGLGKVTMEH